MPLAVVGSNVVVEVNGRKVRGRQYPWGVAEGTFHPIMTYMNVSRIVPLLHGWGGYSSANDWHTCISTIIQVHVFREGIGVKKAQVHSGYCSSVIANEQSLSLLLHHTTNDFDVMLTVVFPPPMYNLFLYKFPRRYFSYV